MPLARCINSPSWPLDEGEYWADHPLISLGPLLGPLISLGPLLGLGYIKGRAALCAVRDCVQIRLALLHVPAIPHYPYPVLDVALSVT